MQSLKFSALLVFMFIKVEAFAQALQSQAAMDTIVLPDKRGLTRNASLFDFQPRINSQNFTPGNRYNPYQLIQGKIPGVIISRPGGDPNYGYQVQIRGLHSGIYNGFAYFPTANGYTQQFNTTQPLVVVDGTPGVSIHTVDPQDIASLEVIKDAASLAAYGMRGANGVVQIQTKRGEVGTHGLQYSTYLAIDQAYQPDLGISASTYRQLIGQGGPFQGVNSDLGANTDWYKLISRQGFSQAHNLALQGTALDAAYRLSVNFRQVNGVAQKSGFDQVNALFNFQKKWTKGKGKLDGLFAITSRQTTEVNPDVFRNAALMNPTAPVRSDTALRTGGYYQPYLFGLFNPVAILHQQTIENSYQTITGALSGEWKLLAGITGKLQSGFQQNQDTYGWALTPGNLFTSDGTIGDAVWEKRTLNHLYLNASLQGDWALSKHKVQTQLGYTYQRWDGQGLTRDANSFGNQTPRYQPLITEDWKQQGWTVKETNYRESDEMPAAYLQSQYIFNERWFVQGSLRREGFTRLGPDDKWTLYPALTLGTVLINQGKILNYLKVRAGYGITGNVPPKTYATQLVVLPGGYNVFINGTFKPGIYYPFVPNPNLQSEVRKELNIGLDFFAFNQRLQGQIQWYRSRSSNLLWQYTTQETDGFSNVYFENRMALRNQGIEVQLNLAAIKSTNLNWHSSLSLAHNQTVLDAPFPQSGSQANVNQLQVGSPGSPGYCCGALQLLQNQQPIGQFYTYRNDGINADGQWRIRDLNGDGFIEETKDKTVTGNAQPTLTLGWDNTLQWQRFSFNMFWRGALGHHVINVFELFYANPQRLKEISGSIPAVALSGEFAKLKTSFNPISDYFVQNAGFFRLDNLTLSYDIPFAKTKPSKKLHLYLSAQNLLTITSFTGNDPDLRLSNLGASLVPGLANPNYFPFQRDLSSVDRGRYPLTQSWLFGLKVSL